MYLRNQDPRGRTKPTAKHAPGYYLGLHEDWNRHLTYDPELKRTVAPSIYKQGMFTPEETWDPDAIEGIRALPWLWDTNKYDHDGGVPHVKNE